uniref:Carbonyl reductase [NADPH] 1 n=1 Tax=Trichuris muris TaxID=70415 RepID=A0A5S6QPP5_TRIMR
MVENVAVVTGANRGIGYGIVKGLCTKFDGTVYLTARKIDCGISATVKMQTEVDNMRCGALRFHQLDITDRKSICRLKQHLLLEHGGLDILINNAGVHIKGNEIPIVQDFAVTFGVNYCGTKAVCEELFPILRPGARVVNVSSQKGMLHCIKSEQLRNRLTSPTLTMAQLDDIIQEFVLAVKENKKAMLGFPESNYAMSKLGVIVATRIQQKMFDESGRPDIIVNSCCPGYVSTDMTDHKGILTLSEGAKTPLYLALENASNLPRGKFVYMNREINWAESVINQFG